jgi:uncharacterized membrane protein YgdD (TMEM256/DUF423 family)
MLKINSLIALAALLGMLGIVLGAFGAHAWKTSLAPEDFRNFETGVRYQMYHALLLFGVNTTDRISEKTKKEVSLLLVLGIFCFSGSLYLISLGNRSPTSIWFVTPLGGLFLLLGWMRLAGYFLANRKS